MAFFVRRLVGFEWTRTVLRLRWLGSKPSSSVLSDGGTRRRQPSLKKSLQEPVELARTRRSNGDMQSIDRSVRDEKKSYSIDKVYSRSRDAIGLIARLITVAGRQCTHDKQEELQRQQEDDRSDRSFGATDSTASSNGANGSKDS